LTGTVANNDERAANRGYLDAEPGSPVLVDDLDDHVTRLLRRVDETDEAIPHRFRLAGEVDPPVWA